MGAREPPRALALHGRAFAGVAHRPDRRPRYRVGGDGLRALDGVGGQAMTSTEANALDASQYTPDEIRKYEAIYGRNFISPGGEATARELLGLVALKPGLRV